MVYYGFGCLYEQSCMSLGFDYFICNRCIQRLWRSRGGCQDLCRCSSGIAGYYATQASRQGCIGITGTNARPSVAPTWGVDGMFGTNPLTIGIPTDEDFDFILDCATSITQNGKIEYYIRTGEPVHQGTVRSIYEDRRFKKELYKASKQAKILSA